MCGVVSPQDNTSTQIHFLIKKLIFAWIYKKSCLLLKDPSFRLVSSDWNSVMAISLCNPQLLPPFSVQHRKFSTKIRSSLNQNLNQENPQLQRFASSRRFRHISTLKSASVNGYPIAKEDEVPSTGGVNFELTEKLKKWVKFAREIFPGGEWWRLSNEEVGDVIAAKSVTVFRALKKMWDLIAEDRWVIFTAFVTLVITAVCGYLQSSLPFFSNYDCFCQVSLQRFML